MSYGDVRFEFENGHRRYIPNPYDTYNGEEEEGSECGRYCEICGKFISDGEDYSGICEDCIEENSTLYNLIRAGEEETSDVTINGFLASAFSSSEINEILEKAFCEMLTLLPQKAKGIIKDYVNADKDYFAETVLFNLKRG